MTPVFKILNMRLLKFAAEAAQGCAYDKWDDAFSRRMNNEVWHNVTSTLHKPMPLLTLQDLQTLTPDECTILGFARWSWEFPMRLIPLWAWNLIEDNTPMYDIVEKSVVKNEKLDLDVRGGCTAYGFFITAEPMPTATE
jgi:hypothetical protein